MVKQLKRERQRMQQKLTALYDLLGNGITSPDSRDVEIVKKFRAEFNGLLLNAALLHFAPHQGGTNKRIKQDMEIFLKRFTEQEDDF